MASAVGLSIRAARKAQGWTQQRLADRAKVSRLSVAYWETGRKRPTQEHLKVVARLLRRDLVWSGSDLVLDPGAA